MEAATRQFVIVSLLAAFAAAAWLVHGWIPGLGWAVAGALAAGLLASRLSLTVGLGLALLPAFVAPAVLGRAFDRPDYHVILVWLALAAGPVVAAGDWRRWHLPPPLRLPAIGWSLVLAATWPVIVGREIDYSPVAARTFDTVNGLMGGPPPATAAWVASWIIGHLVGLLWLDLLWARFGHDRVRRAERVVLVPLLASALIGAAAGLYQDRVDLAWANSEFWVRLERASGLMLDANSFGAASALAAPLAVALVWRLGRAWWLAAAAAFAMLAGAMWVAGSRTALLILGAGSVGLLVAGLQRRGTWQPRLVPIGLLVGGAALVLAMAVAPRGGDPSSPLQRVFDRLPRLERGAVSAFADELWTRFGYGSGAVAMIAAHPVAGVGAGAFHTLSSDYVYLTTGVMRPPDNAQNWWRHQLAELGFAGALPSIWLSLAIALLVWRSRTDGPGREAGSVLRAVIGGVGLASLLGVSTQHPAVWLTFVVAVYWLSALQSPPLRIGRPSVPALALLAGLAGAVAVVQLVSARDDLRVAQRAERAGFVYGYGLGPPEPAMDDTGELRWVAAEAVAVVPAQDEWLALTLRAQHPDIAREAVRARVWRDGVLVLDEVIDSHEPRTRYLQMSLGALVRLEFDVSRTHGPGRGLRLAHRWLRQVPSGVPADLTVPR